MHKSKQANLTDQARKKQSKGEFAAAIDLYKRAIAKNPKDMTATINLGICYAATEDYQNASKIFHDVHHQYPENDDIWNFAGKTYLKIGQFEMATKFLQRYVKKHPKSYEAWTNLSFCAMASNNITPAVYYATEALSIQPNNPTSYLNLGSALVSLRKFKEAKECFDTVLELDKNNIQAMGNIGNIYNEIGAWDASIQMYQQCLKLLEEGSEGYHDICYRMSFPLLSTGKINQGWKLYESGLKLHDQRARHPQRKFSVPQWNGEVIKDKTILVWREQGIGDEFRFLSLLPSMLDQLGKVIIECSPRLLTLLTRAFPTCEVRAESINYPRFNSNLNDYDYHIPIASLCGLYFKDELKISPPKPYIKPDQERIKFIQDRLSQYKGKKLIGICWRSGMINSERNINYCAISEWEHIFRTENCVFVNLQYGDCIEEIENVKKDFGVDIINWHDVDLKNDFEMVAAIIDCVDLVITAGTAVHSIAEAVGKRLFLLAHIGFVNLGQEKWPWAEDIKIFSPVDSLTPMNTIVPEVANALSEFCN